jgi:two-component system cell cycle response regulator DivK
MEPLAVLVCDNLLLLSRIANALQQIKYRVRTLRDPAALLAVARDEQPLFVILDLTLKSGDPCAAVAQLKADDSLKHLPVLAFADHTNKPLLDRARAAGADAVTSNAAVAQHLPQLIEQLLAV